MPEPPVAAPDHTETLERILDYYEADAKALDGIAVMLGLRQAQLGREALAALLVERRQDKERIERLETTLEWALDCLEISLARLDTVDDLSPEHHRIRAAGLAKARAVLAGEGDATP